MFQEDQEHTVVLYTCGYCSRAFHQPKSNEQPGEDLKKNFCFSIHRDKPLQTPYHYVDASVAKTVHNASLWLRVYRRLITKYDAAFPFFRNKS